MEKISVKKALDVGQLYINLPVFLCMFGFPGIVYVYTLFYKDGLWLIPLSIILGFVSAWVWWSYCIVKWRLWAFSSVNDVKELERKAIASQLIWPKGNWFNKTEIWTSLQRAQWEEIRKELYNEEG